MGLINTVNSMTMRVNMRFKEYLEHTKNKNLTEELVYGGATKVLKKLEYWFDFSDRTTEERIHRLEQDVINAGGVAKFEMVVRRIPSVKHFLIKHIAELTGDLAKVAKDVSFKHKRPMGSGY